MLLSNSVGAEIARSTLIFPDALALADGSRQVSYAQLGQFASALGRHMNGHKRVGVFGAPGLVMGASAIGCVIQGIPFVHLDPAMPQMVLHNILSELEVTLVVVCQAPAAGQLPGGCEIIEALSLLEDPKEHTAPLQAGAVDARDPIYLVATSGTTGRPKSIPVSQEAAFLSYAWRDSFTPYSQEMRVCIYIFAIWELFRPLRNGASLWFPDADTLFAPSKLADFLISNRIDEMLFTPSYYDTFLNALDAKKAAEVPLSRVILNGEVVGDTLISTSLQKLPNAALWNLYSICETHDISMSLLTEPAGDRPATVGVPMEYLRAVILDENEQPCPVGTSGQLFFEGPRMLGPGYVNRPEETRLRFREMIVDGREARLYDTGDQARQDENGALYIEGRIAHMLKLRGYSIQTRELTETMQQHLSFSSAVPWVTTVGNSGQHLVFYFAADADQQRKNADDWGLVPGTNRTPQAIAAVLRDVLPHYCIPSYLVQMESLPLHPVSGKADTKALPPVEDLNGAPKTDLALTDAHTEDAVIRAAALAMSCRPDAIDPALSFHDQGGDSLMCVTLMLELEKTYGLPVEFDVAMNVPLHRIDQLMTQEADAPAPMAQFDHPGILLTGATGFLGGHVLAQAARDLPEGEVIYCLVRNKNRGARDRLDEVARLHKILPNRLVMVLGTLDAPQFGLETEAYRALTKNVTRVIHCAAMVNLALGQKDMLEWSARGMTTILDFCHAARADLRFTSSTSAFPDRGGPWPEAPTTIWDACTGYGAAKIAAENAIVSAGISSAIVRLPSLYDLNSPNLNDIYEIVLRESYKAAQIPLGLTFPMIDVSAAAAFLLGDITAPSSPVYNLIPDRRVVPGGLREVPERVWAQNVSLDPGIARVIQKYPDTLCADALFENRAARNAWSQINDKPFEEICDAPTLLEARARFYQGEPAFTG